jgi:hypothetical protein
MREERRQGKRNDSPSSSSRRNTSLDDGDHQIRPIPRDRVRAAQSSATTANNNDIADSCSVKVVAVSPGHGPGDLVLLDGGEVEVAALEVVDGLGGGVDLGRVGDALGGRLGGGGVGVAGGEGFLGGGRGKGRDSVVGGLGDGVWVGRAGDSGRGDRGLEGVGEGHGWLIGCREGGRKGEKEKERREMGQTRKQAT